MNVETDFTVGSACTGVGGLDLGLERAGMRVVWQCEADEKCRTVLARHWPGVPCYPDLTQLHRPPIVRLFCGGFPCQDLSVAGRGAGLDGERSVLFFDLARVASVVLGAAGWFLVENVPGLISNRQGRDFAIVLATLAELGFHDLAWRVLDSRYFDVPQRRKRVFILARLSRGRSCAEVLLEPDSGGGNHQAGGREEPQVAATLSHGSSRPGVSAPGRRQEDDQNVVGAIDTEGGGVDDNSARAGHIVGALTRRDGKGPNSDCDNGQIIGFLPEEVGTLRSSSSSSSIGLDTPEQYPLVSGTLRSNGRNNSNGLTEARSLVAAADPDREGAASGLPGRLDGPLRPFACPFDPKPDAPREAQMGNAVTVSVAHWIGRRILDYERGRLNA